MKKYFGYIGTFALAAAMAINPVAASAGTLANGALPAGAVFANELFGTGSNATVLPTAGATANYTMASAPASDFIVTYTLGGGATWGVALTSASLAFVETVAPASTVTIALIGGGLTTDSSAQFRVTVNTPVTAGDIFRLTYQIKNATALAATTGKITLGITLTDNLGAVDTPSTVDAFTSGDATTEAIAASSAAGTLFIDVATGNKNFGGTSADRVSTTEVVLGQVSVADGGAQREDDGTTDWAINVGDATAAGTLTLAGSFGASLAVNADANAATADGLWIDLNGNNARDAGEEADSLTSGLATWNLTGAELAALTGAGNTGKVHMVVDGATAISEQTPSATLLVNWTVATYADDSKVGNLRALAKNGTTRRVFNLPASDNSNNEQAFIRITNTSAITGNVRGTLFAQDGTNLGTQIMITSIAPQATVALSAAQIEDIFNVDPWAGRARLVIDAEIPSMEVMGLIRTSAGILTNMSPMAIQ